MFFVSLGEEVGEGNREKGEKRRCRVDNKNGQRPCGNVGVGDREPGVGEVWGKDPELRQGWRGTSNGTSILGGFPQHRAV